MKPLIHFAHANGIPSQTYQKIFDALSNDFDIVYMPLIGVDGKYAVTNHWNQLVQQMIESIERQAQGRKVILLGHSLGSVLSLMTARERPDLVERVLMLDPPLIVGIASFVFHMAKIFSQNAVDKLTPAGLSAKRRDHWNSKEQAAELLRDRGFFKTFDIDCFNAYIEFGIKDDLVNGGVTLTIPKATEVEIFRTTPSWWWLPQAKMQVPTTLIVGRESEFLKNKLPQAAKRKLGIPFHIVEGGHMFPLQYPLETASLIKNHLLVENED